MYIKDFDTFFQQAEELYRSRPLETRYSVKYRHQDGELVLKVTDDKVCLKYKTDQQVDIKKMEKLNNMFFALMARGEYTPDAEGTQAAEQLQQPSSSKGRKGRQRG